MKSAVGMIWGECEQDLYVDQTPGFHLPARPLPLSTQIPEKIFGAVGFVLVLDSLAHFGSNIQSAIWMRVLKLI